MSGRAAVAQGFPLTLSPSKGERKAFFNGLCQEEEYNMNQRTKVMTVGLLCGMLTLSVAAGCATHSTKTTQTVTSEESAPAAVTDEVQPQRPDTTTVTTTTTTESDNSSPGIIGSAFGLVWAVVSFPFRVIGALF